MDQNPYAAPTPQPQAGVPSAPAYSVETGGLSPRLIDLFRRTKGWVQFLGVLTIIGGIFILIAALGIIFGMSTAMSNSRGISYLPAGFFIMVGLIYLVMSVVAVTLGVKLIGYGASIRALTLTNNMLDAELAVDKQRGIWKICGIMAIIFLSLMVLGIIANIASM